MKDFLCVSASPAGIIFVGRETDTISISGDNGDSWNNIKIPINSIWGFLFTSNGEILPGGWGCVMVSIDNGLTWQTQNQGLPENNVYGFYELVDGSVLLGLNSKELFKRNPGETSWKEWGNIFRLYINCERE